MDKNASVNKGKSQFVKIGVKYENLEPQLLEIDLQQPLCSIMKLICSGWGISDVQNFGLQKQGSYIFVTEQSKNDIKTADVLCLQQAPTIWADKLITLVQSSVVAERKKGLEQLTRFSEDPSFATEFIAKNGVEVLVKYIEATNEMPDILLLLLASFEELAGHGIIRWEKVTVPMVKKLTALVKNNQTSDPKVLQQAMSILETVIINHPGMFSVICGEITLEKLIFFIQGSNIETRIKALSLINAVFAKTPAKEKSTVISVLQDQGLRSRLMTLESGLRNKMPSELALQLYLYQSIMFYSAEESSKSAPDQNIQIYKDQVQLMYSKAFDTDTIPGQRQSSLSSYLLRLGFKNDGCPLKDFEDVPPGSLALSCSAYFCRNYTDLYKRLIADNLNRDDRHQCPFVPSVIATTKLLLEVLHIGETAAEQGDYLPMLLACDHPFEELFCILIQLVHKTWKEMKACKDDFPRVLGVVQKQITQPLSDKLPSMDVFKERTFSMNFTSVLKIIQQESMERHVDSKIKPIVELREKKTAELKELVRQQRLAQLVEGQLFKKVTSKSKRDKGWYWRLAPNQRFLHFGDSGEGDDSNQVPPLEALPEKLPVADIKEIRTFRDLQNQQKENKKLPLKNLLVLTILLKESDVRYDLLASNEKVYSVWEDGLNALLNREMVSKESADDLSTLLNMTMRLLLLDLENVKIPENPPPIPPDPPNYNFFYQFGLSE